MPKSLLAVDDSVTMRKVIEMTFAGEDIRVTTTANTQDALAACRKSPPDIVLADVALEGQSGYDLCRAIKDEFKGIPVVILSSKQNPYDAAKGQASGADGNLDKPYDTAKAIELVKKTLEQGKSVAPAPIAAAPVAGVAPAPRAPMFGREPAAPAPAPAPAAPRPFVAAPPQPHLTMPGMPAAGAPRPPVALSPQVTRQVQEPAPALQKNPTPALQRTSTVKMSSDAPPAAQIQHGSLAELAQHPPTGNGGGVVIGGELAGKLGKLGLSPAQVEAVLALSREVVEQVVWEVVPVLAETLVKEEIARLTRE